ncbi:hypothetical protein SLE2022_067710 [Rubroshorea leprosula]
METGDQYPQLPDLRRLLSPTTHFPPTPQPTQLPYFAPHHETFNTMGFPSGLARFGHVHAHQSTPTTVTGATTSRMGMYGVEMESGWCLGNDGGNSRWPRQETLTLLEIRSRLDSKFKEANQKGPLWDEVSRIMAEEHGYQRSGKKCREKFENLYKYYKKTKEGKAGRQDGKNYRFFRQLEALYGEKGNNRGSSIQPETNAAQKINLPQTPNNTTYQENQEQYYSMNEQKLLSESLSFSNTISEFETSSSDDHNELQSIALTMEKQKRKSWKTKVKGFVESQMKKLMETQEAWMERMLKTIEDREQERVLKEEEWRREETSRFEREHQFWAKERAWFETRDGALIEALKKFSGKGLEVSSSAEVPVTTETQFSHDHQIIRENIKARRIGIDALNANGTGWTEPEISKLMQLRTTLEPRFQGYSKKSIWEEIEAKMVSLGYDRDAFECREKWESMHNMFIMNMSEESNKKRKEDLRISNYYQQVDSTYDGQEIGKQRVETIDSPSSSYVVNEGENFYGLKMMSKGKNHM